MIQEEISQRYHDQHIPEDVWYQKSLAERYDIIQVTVNDVAAFFRNQILGKKIESEIDHPAKQQLQVRELRIIELR